MIKSPQGIDDGFNQLPYSCQRTRQTCKRPLAGLAFLVGHCIASIGKVF